MIKINIIYGITNYITNKMIGEGLAGIAKCFLLCCTGIRGIGSEERTQLINQKKIFELFRKKWQDNPKTINELKQYLDELKKSIYKNNVGNYYNSSMYESIIYENDYIDLAIYICNKYDNIQFVINQYEGGNYNDYCCGSEFNPTILFNVNSMLTIKFEILCKKSNGIYVEDAIGMNKTFIPKDCIKFIDAITEKYCLKQT